MLYYVNTIEDEKEFPREKNENIIGLFTSAKCVGEGNFCG